MARKILEDELDESIKECSCEHDCDCEDCCDDNCDCKEDDCREEEFKEILQRVQAEFENYRRRTESSFEKIREDGIVHSINKLLPVLDSFKSAKALVQNEEFLNSLNLIEKQFLDGLSALNVTKIDALGETFNPKFHNAVLTDSIADKADEEVLEVYQDGYKLNDRIIRYSVVKINKLS